MKNERKYNMSRKIGFEKAIVAALDDDEQIIKDAENGLSAEGIYTIDAKSSLGVIQGAITGLAPTATKIWGSDQMVDVSQKGSGNVQATLSANDLPADILYKLAGYKKDETTGAYIQDVDTKPIKAGLVLVSHNSKGQEIYFALYKGTFGPEEVTLNTNNEQQSLQTDSLTFSALNRFSDKRIYGYYTLDPEGLAKDEATILGDVFKGFSVK